MRKATEIIRFVSTNQKILYGQRVAPHAQEAHLLLSNNPFDSLDLSTVRAPIKKLLAPIVPTQIIGIGLNYRKHAEETGKPIPMNPIVFFKTLNTIIGHEESILLPECTQSPSEVDYEAELAIVIGKDCKNVPEQDALQYVLGYMCANDVSARKWQGPKGGNQWCRGKSFDTFCPIGPVLVTKEKVKDPQNVSIRGLLNGQVVQESNTKDMIFSIASIISKLSEDTTIKKGTLILTGTPEGVGYTRKPIRVLEDKDVFQVEIESIGRLSNLVKKAPKAFF